MLRRTLSPNCLEAEEATVTKDLGTSVARGPSVFCPLGKHYVQTVLLKGEDNAGV